MTKTEQLKKILETLDWDLDMEDLANGPVTAQRIRDFENAEWEGYADDVLAHLAAARLDVARLEPEKDWERVCSLLEELHAKTFGWAA